LSRALSVLISGVIVVVVMSDLLASRSTNRADCRNLAGTDLDQIGQW